VEHGFWADREAVNLMAELGIVWVPTIVAATNAIGSGRFNDAALQAIAAHHAAMLRYGDSVGVLLASGSDCGAYNVPHGAGTDDEYDALEKLGINPERGNAAIAERFRANPPRTALSRRSSPH
jgi:hypothetical protein